MRAVLQRVRRASVTVEHGGVVAAIGPGLLVLLGVAAEDGEAEVEWLARKIPALRIFPDEDGRMNAPLGGGEILCVSQFTLLADARRGNRPGFAGAAPGDRAAPLYERFCELVGAQRGVFGAHMEVELVNDGPVTLVLDTVDRPR